MQQLQQNIDGIQARVCDPSIRRLATWNMQGANWGDIGINPWQSVENWFRNKEFHIDICCLQECGRLPGSVTQNNENLLEANIHNQVNFRLYQWRIGSTSRGLYLYILFYEWDEGANRVNLAIVLRVRPALANIMFVAALHEERLRPLIGVRINNRDYYSIHASANGGGDAATLVSRVENEENQFIIAPRWIIAGDYNQEPNTLQGRQHFPRDATICPPNSPTHPTNPTEPGRFPFQSRLDYAVWSKPHPIEGQVDQTFRNTGGTPASDHLPVFYRLDEF